MQAPHERSFTRVELPSGQVIQVEIAALGGPEMVGMMEALPFSGVPSAVESIAEAFADSFRRVGPTKATIEFGMEIGLESGKLTALLVKGTGKANLKVTLEWDRSQGPVEPPIDG